MAARVIFLVYLALLLVLANCNPNATSATNGNPSVTVPTNGDPNVTTATNVIPTVAVVTNSDPCSTHFGEPLSPRDVNDNTSVGTIIYPFNPDLFNATLTKGQIINCRESEYLSVNGSGVFLVKSLLNNCDLPGISCRISCKYEQNQAITQTVRITIHKVAFSLPIFKHTQYNKAIKESESIDTNIKDFGDEFNYTDCFSKSAYKVFHLKEDFNGTFEIESGSGIMKLKKPVDYESQHKSYTLNVSAEFPPEYGANRIAVTQLIVKVLDVDDMDPAFSNDTYNLKFKEENNSAINSWLPTTPPIHAEDRDEGEGKQNISYSFKDNKYASVFEINVDNGTIKVMQTLDRELIKQYTIILQAVQKNDPLRSATATLSINVEDVNDSLPKFVTDPHHVQITEHSFKGTYVTEVSADDKDEGEFGKVLYQLTNNEDIFEIDNSTGVVYVKNGNLLDREKQETMSLMIEAIDANSRKRGDNITVEISLQDINDNSPEFEVGSGYHFQINSTAVGMKVGQVVAIDNDADDNGNVTYEILRVSDYSRFEIDAISGDITLKNVVDGIATFIVQACDNPVAKHNRRCSIVGIDVTTTGNTTTADIIRHANVQENSNIGSIVAQLKVDGQHYSVIPNDTFTIDDSGLVTTKKILDREETEVYNVSVMVMGIGGRVIANISLQIDVLDVNDNAPVFEKDDYIFALNEDLQNTDIIGTVKAFDNDESGNNSKIQYTIQNSVDSAYFDIGIYNGHIYRSSNIMATSKNLYELTVVATDLGVPALSSFVSVLISRIIVKDNTVKLSTPLDIGELQRRQKQLDSDISKILNVTVLTEKTEENKPRSYMYISAKYRNSSVVPGIELQRLVLQHMNEIDALFSTTSRYMARENTSSFGASEIALVVIAATILIGTLVAILIIHYKWNNKEKYDRLNQTLTRRSSLYESQEIKMRMDEETSDYTGSLNTNEFENGNGNGHQVSEFTAFSNPIYTDDETQLKTSASAVEAINEAISSLDHAYQYEEENETSVLKENGESTDQTDNIDTINDHSGNADNGRDLYNVQQQFEEPLKDYELADQNQVGEDQAGSSNAYENVDLPEPILEPVPNHEHVLPVQLDAHQDKENGEHEYANIKHNNDEDEDEPQPDYNLKQVRFSGEVLDTDENKIEPLKEETFKADNSPDTDSDADSSKGDNLPPPIMSESDDNDETLFKLPSDHMDESDRVDEEINSPTNFLKPETETSDNTSGTFNFGAEEYQDEVTAL